MQLHWLEHTKPFIGRSKEMSHVIDWLDDPQAPSRILYISGMGGIGKSSLMTEMMLAVQQRHWTSIWLDGRSCLTTPVGFFEYLASAIQLERYNRQPVDPLEVLISAHASHRIAIFIDNSEHISLLEGWIMNAFWPKMSSQGVLLVFASRSPIPLVWKTNPHKGRHITELPLAHFSFAETMDYISHTGAFSKEISGEIARSSDGHPLGLALAVEAVQKKQELSNKDTSIVSQTISAHLLRELTTDEVQPCVDALIVLQQANQEMLSKFLGRPVTIQQYRLLQSMSFIRTVPDGIALHDIARMHLHRDFRAREPERLEELRTKAAKLLYQQFRHVDLHHRREIAAKLLYLCKDTLQSDRLYADWTVDSPDSPLEIVTEADLPVLHELLDQWCDYSIDPWQRSIYHQFMDELVEQFPESIVVLREADGKPIGMFMLLLMHRDTSRLMEQYIPSELHECFTDEELACSADQADTYYAVLAAATDKHPMFTREEIVGLLTRDRLSLLGQGSRAVLVATNPNLKTFLQQVGFQLRPTRTRNCDTSYARADILELDLRQERFGEWIMSFFTEQTSESSEQGSTITVQDVRKMLSCLHEPGKLNHYTRFFPAIANGVALQAHLLSILEHNTYRLQEHDLLLLNTAYNLHPHNHIAASLACNMSRATYYRYLNKAVQNMTEMIKSKGLH